MVYSFRQIFRDIQAVYFDIEGTLIINTTPADELLPRIAKYNGHSKEIVEMQKQSVYGGLNNEWYINSLVPRVNLVRGVHESSVIYEAHEMRKDMHPKAYKVVDEFRRRGKTPAIMSGSFKELAEPTARALGISHLRFNQFIYDEDRKINGVKEPSPEAGVRTKGETKNNLKHEMGLKDEEIIIVEDSWNIGDAARGSWVILLNPPRDLIEYTERVSLGTAVISELGKALDVIEIPELFKRKS